MTVKNVGPRLSTLARHFAVELTDDEIDEISGGLKTTEEDGGHQHGTAGCRHYTTVKCNIRWDDGG